MNNFIKQISGHVMFQPMCDFLSLANLKTESFIDQLYKQDESIIKIMETLHHFGFFHILIPFNEVISAFGEEQASWWSSKASSLENYGQMMCIQNAFHDRAMAFAAETTSFKPAYPWSFRTSYSEMQTMLWDSYPGHIAPVPESNKESNLGILIPGFYSSQLHSDYLKFLGSYALPHLLEMAKKYESYLIVPNKYEAAAIKLAVHVYSTELGQYYSALFFDSLPKVVAYKDKEPANMRYQDYKNLIFYDGEQSPSASFPTITWVLQLKELARYEKKFTGNHPYALSCSLPVLMQCVGLNEDASDYLLRMSERLTIKECSSGTFLLALYRAILTDRSSYRSTLMAKMESILDAKEIPDDLIDILEDIYRFYQALTDELPKRFQKETLEQLIAHAEEPDHRLYEKYLAYLERNAGSRIRLVQWAYDCLFSGNRLVSQMEVHLKAIKNINTPYDTKIMHVYLFQNLFSSLAAHLNHDVRISVQPCLEYLNMNKEEPFTIKASEIFDVYSHSQHQKLIELNQRLRQETEYIPNYYTIAQFENIGFEKKEIDPQTIQELKNNVQCLNERMELLEKAQRYYYIIYNYILIYCSDTENTLHQAIMDALISNSELTLEFCNEINEICSNSAAAQLPSEQKDVMKKISRLLEQAISHPEGYKHKIMKSEFLSAANALINCIPVVSTASNILHAILSIKKALDTLELDSSGTV